MSNQLFGWIPPDGRTVAQEDRHQEYLAQMPKFSLPPVTEEGRYPLWKAGFKLLGRHLPFIWQLTGSCVGAGGCNMLQVLMAVEIASGDNEEFTLPWWPYTYGQSRRLGGMDGRGEGSFGSVWAQAIKECGIFAQKMHSGLPAFRDVQGWTQATREVELDWSDGDSKFVEPWKSLGLKYPVQTVAPIRSTQDAKAALVNGYPITIASMFGTRTIRRQGSPAVNVAEYDTQWAHQMSINECWDHPTLGLLFLVQNNWGPDAHPAPSQEEPPGSFYVRENTLARVLSERGTECYAFSAFRGFPARKLDWFI